MGRPSGRPCSSFVTSAAVLHFQSCIHKPCFPKFDQFINRSDAGKPLFSIPIGHCLYCLYWKNGRSAFEQQQPVQTALPWFCLKFKFISAEMSIGFSQTSLGGQYRSILFHNNTFCLCSIELIRHWM